MAYIGASGALTNQAVSTDVFSGNGSNTVFTLSRTVYNTRDIEVVVNNVQQNPFDSSYSVSGQTLTLSGAPSAGANNIYVIYQAGVIGVMAPTDNSVTANSIQTSAVTAVKLHTTAITDKLGYTPANKAGDTFTGAVTVSNTLSAGNTTVTGSVSTTTLQVTGNATITGAVTFSNTATFASNGAVFLPAGNTSQRPTGSRGALRYNVDSNTPEWYSNNAWNSIASTSDPYYTSTKVLVKNGSLTDASYVRRTITNGGATSTSSVAIPPITKTSSLTGSGGSAWLINNNNGSSYLSFGGTMSHFDLSQTAWTLEYWLYAPSGGTSYGHTFWCGGQSNQGEFKMSGADRQPYLYSAVGQTVGSSAVSANVWTWVVFERYNGVVYCWINGTNRTSGSTMPTGGTPANAGLGWPFNTEYWGHYVDEVRFTTVSRYFGAATIPVQTASWPEQ